MKCSSAFSMLIAAMKLSEKFSDGSHLLDVLEDINEIEAESKYDLEKFSDGSHLLDVLESINQIEAESKYDQEEVEGGGENDVSAGIFTDSPMGSEVDGQFKVIAIKCLRATEINSHDEIYIKAGGRRWPQTQESDPGWYTHKMKVIDYADQISVLTLNFGTQVCLYEEDFWGDELLGCVGPEPNDFMGQRVFSHEYTGHGGWNHPRYQIWFEYTGNNLGGSAVSTWRNALNQCVSLGSWIEWEFLEDEEMEIPCHENPKSLFYVTEADEIKSLPYTDRCLQSVPQSFWQTDRGNNQYAFFLCTGGDNQKWNISGWRDTTGLEIRSKQQDEGRDMCLQSGDTDNPYTDETFDTMYVEECSEPGVEDSQLFEIPGWNDFIPCHPIEVSGRWEKMEGSQDGGVPGSTVRIEECTGIETSLTESTTRSWVEEASRQAWAGLEGVYGGIGVGLETKIQEGIENTMEYSYTKNNETCVERVMPAGVWWQYVYDITDSHCGNNVAKPLEFAFTYSTSTPPCCLPGFNPNQPFGTAHSPCEENMPCLCQNADGTDMDGCSCLALNTECNYYSPANQLECDQDPICCNKCCDGNWAFSWPWHYTCDYASS